MSPLTPEKIAEVRQMSTAKLASIQKYLSATDYEFVLEQTMIEVADDMGLKGAEIGFVVPTGHDIKGNTTPADR